MVESDPARWVMIFGSFACVEAAELLRSIGPLAEWRIHTAQF